MRLLRRYVLRSLAGPFLFSLGACTGLLLVNQLARKLGDLVGKDLSWQVIAEVLGLSIPFIIALTLPMAVLVAILYGYSQLGQDSEITAMRANGVSVLQMLMPALVAGVVLTGINFLFVDQILPRTNARLGNLQNDIAQKKPAFQMREQAINALNPYFIRAARVYPGSGRLTDVEIFDFSLSDTRRVIYADSGVMSFDAKGTDLILLLHTGKVHEYKRETPGQIQITRFDLNTIRVKNVQNLFERDTINFRRGDREMTTCEMMDRVTSSRRQAERAGLTRPDMARQDLRALMRLVQSGATVRPRDTTTVQHCGRWRTFEQAVGKWLLPEAAHAQQPAPPRPVAQPAPKPPAPVVLAPDTSARLAVPGQQPAILLSSITDVSTTVQDERAGYAAADMFLVEIHKKYAISMACFTFVLIGVAMALRFPRGGMGLVIGGGSGIFAIFYVGLVGGEALADRGFVSPAVAMWAPNLIVMVVGIVGLIRVNREFGSTRGGDLADLFDTLTRPFRFRRRDA